MNGYEPHGPMLIDPPDYTQITSEEVAERFPTTRAAALVGTAGTVLLHPVDGLPAVKRNDGGWGWTPVDANLNVSDAISTSLLLAIIRARHEAHLVHPTDPALEVAAALLAKSDGRKATTNSDRTTAGEILNVFSDAQTERIVDALVDAKVQAYGTNGLYAVADEILDAARTVQGEQ